jgi:uncharacterized protein (TIGR02145 family)
MASSSSSGGGTSSNSDTFTDSRDNQTYKMVKIGEQIWMAENLKYAVGGKCGGTDNKLQSGNTENCNKYGRLYDWATATTICPSGWHLPSKEEWDALSNYVQSDKVCSSCDAKHLKATSDWNNNGNGLDSYGFSALPGGRGDSGGYLVNAGYFGYWWSSTDANAGSPSNAIIRDMGHDYENVHQNYSGKDFLHSVRCVKNFTLQQ